MTSYSLKSEPAHPARNHVDSLDGMQKDLLAALHDDQVKQQVNDAKIRAVKQRVEYDEFEKLVAGAHLRPIKPKSQTLDEIGKQFDGFVLPKHEPAPVGPKPPPKAAVATAASADAVPPTPKTSNEFARVWKRQCKTAAGRFAYLRQLDTETLPLIFKTELDPSLFDGIVAALGETCLGGGADGEGDAPAAAAAAPAVVDLSDVDGDEPAAPAASSSAGGARKEQLTWTAALLAGISRLNRFDLTLDFTDKVTLETLGKLFDAMAAGGVDGTDALRAKYKS